MTTFRNILMGLLVLVVCAVGPASAQTALNSTTLSAAVSSSADSVTVASASNISANDLIFVDREAMRVTAISGTRLSVSRGAGSTLVAAHVTGALVYTGAANRFYSSVPYGACTRASSGFLPRIVLPSGDLYDCPAGAQVWSLLNAPATHTSRSEAFNLDNGSGTTIDSLLIRPARPIVITACRVVYEDATTGTVAAGSTQVGTTVDGEEIVAVTNYENTKAVGTTTALAIVSGFVASSTPVLVRHTGVAATQAGEAVVECDWHYR